MNKLVAITLFALLSVAYAEVKGEANGLEHQGTVPDHTDDYVTLNGLQYKQVLDGFDAKLQDFEENYLQRLSTVEINREFVVKSVIRAVSRWDPMLVLSDFTKQCIVKYRYNIPTVEVTKAAITKCHDDYSKQISALVIGARSIRNSLVESIAHYYKEVDNCGSKHGKSSHKYTLCVADLTSKTNELVISNEKAFQVHLEASACTATANVKSAIDCSYNVQVRTHTIIAETDVMIDKCMWHKDECKPCDDHTCTESYDLELNVKNETIYNPFFGRSDAPKCIKLNVV